MEQFVPLMLYKNSDKNKCFSKIPKSTVRADKMNNIKFQ